MTAITITVDGESHDVPESLEANDEHEADGSSRGMIDRGPMTEISHSSSREAIQEIHGMGGRRVWITSTLREEGVNVAFYCGVLKPIRFLDDGAMCLTLEDETAEIYPPISAATDRHVENGLVVLRTANGFEMEFQVIAGE